MIRVKHKGEWERQERGGERGRGWWRGEGKKRFSFFSPEESKWLVEMETRRASTHTVGNTEKQERMGTERRIEIESERARENTTEFFGISRCQSFWRLDDRDKLKRDLLHDWNTKRKPQEIDGRNDDKYYPSIQWLFSYVAGRRRGKCRLSVRERERESTFHISYFLVEQICHVVINRSLSHNCKLIDFHVLELRSTLHAVKIFTRIKTSNERTCSLSDIVGLIKTTRISPLHLSSICSLIRRVT